MTLGWRLFLHSVRQLLFNLGPAFRISVVPVLIALGVMLLLLGSPSADQGISELTGPLVVRLLIALLVALSMFIWIAVAWHRFILLQEPPGPFYPRARGEPILSYVGATLRIILAGIVIGIGIGLIAGVLSGLFARLPLGVTIAMMLVLQIVMSAVFLRISMILPAAAIGARLSMGDAWNRSAGRMGAIIVLSVLISLLSMIPDLLGQTPLAVIVYSLPYQVLSQWLLAMLSVSVLTTLYGHFIEGRDLVV